MATSHRKLLLLVGSVVSASLLAGCATERPIVSANTQTTNETWEEQRVWVAGELDSAVDASGVPDGWFDLYWTDLFWAIDRPEDKAIILRGLMPHNCVGAGARLTTAVKNFSSDSPLEAAAKIRSSWESRGWVITDIWATPSPGKADFRADNGDGAMLELYATEELISIGVYGACSVNSTMTDWQSHVGETNEFADELERRGEGVG